MGSVVRMVQIQLPEQEKVQGMKAVVPSVGAVPLLPHTVRNVVGTRKHQQTGTNKSCIFLVFLSILFAIVSVKKICDLKEENLRLLQLAIERQKDSVLKLAVRDNISPTRFLGHQFS